MKTACCERRTLCSLFSTLHVLLFIAASASAAGMPAQVPAAAKVKKEPEKIGLHLVRDAEDDHGAIKTNRIGSFQAEVLSDREGRAKDLARRDWMAEGEGVLVVVKDPASLWLRVLRMPIDMFCFDRQQRVIALVPDLPSCFLCQLVPVSTDCAYMLEINSGLIKKLGVKAGDRFEVERTVDSKE